MPIKSLELTTKIWHYDKMIKFIVANLDYTAIELRLQTVTK